jgi:DNA polymerase-3 subunit epsilon
MRQVVLDTETTGLEVSQGHRVIEIGCVELHNRRATGRHFHRYLNPEREVDAGARAVHGLSLQELADKPRFAAIADEFTQFISGAQLVIHNASFDVGFLDAEFARLDPGAPRSLTTLCQVLDTLALARGMHPGQRNSLDALCKRYGIDNSHRELHGALLDARILADVYLAMTGGQSALALDEAPRRAARRNAAAGGVEVSVAELPLRVTAASAAERLAHEGLQDLLQKASGGKCLWREKAT